MKKTNVEKFLGIKIVKNIESNYKDVPYYVFWNKDLTAKDLRIK
jgi:hypothetical protein